jgi:hypothetical protein
MADFFDPEVKKFCNEGLRPAMDRLAAAYLAAKALLTTYDATALAGKIPDTPDLVDDDSATDGRPRISCGGVKLSMENLRAMLAQLEAVPPGQPLSMVQGVFSISPQYRLDR